MYTIANLAAISSLVLAIWASGAASRAKLGRNPPAAPATAEKIGLNHNEILVKDAGPIKTEPLPIPLQESALLDPQLVYPRDCKWLECETELTEELRIDTQRVRETKQEASWLTSVWEFFFRRTDTPRPCEEWGCGSNHNEVLARDDCDGLECGPRKNEALKIDTQIVRETQARTSWSTGLWEFLFGGTGDTCPTWGCGENHNELLARDDQ